MTVEESILGTGERERREIVGYIQMLLDSINDLMVKYKQELKNMGVINRLGILTEIITMHKYNPEVYMGNYWEELLSLINIIKQDQKLANEVKDIEELIEKINSLKELVKF
ncbi:hypothetical protein SULI_10410 [Saccharolobus solfataricus]|nr:hypothetical protein [Saccharolobus solfataricus]AKA75105.1 hypothetical protein SULB_2065 [Saccharolobus solfataricus]AKA77799.1 hypothetical protein SULC_2063 [Saccharolobus solfataricus]AKA80493.1 hypothetical protein SULA_2064 [Saccharolobus solfataricus]AZF69554.1 hypothetical protein SULG_10410 [Saccharolobus solfataricus]AZF72174.1 hypothetical protein SULH_10410 [Saccharolobus solfataricus]